MDMRTIRKRLNEERGRLQRIRDSFGGEGLGDGADAEAATLKDVSAPDQHPADVGSKTFERDKDMSILYGVEAELADMERALRRLDEGTYGRCEACGRRIGAARLQARPAARFCIEDQARSEREVRPPEGPAREVHHLVSQSGLHREARRRATSYPNRPAMARYSDGKVPCSLAGKAIHRGS